MSDSNATPMDLAREAVTQLVESIRPGEILTTAVLLYETSEMQEDGQVHYEVSYSALTESSMSSVVGTVQLGQEVLLSQCLPEDGEGND